MRLLEKTIFVPSGDHAGSKSTAELSVSWTWPLPSAFIFQISGLEPFGFLEFTDCVKAMCAPSADHAGSVSIGTRCRSDSLRRSRQG